MRRLLFIALLSMSLSYTWSTSSGTENGNPLTGQHLRVLGLEFPISLRTKRNATGHVVHAEGVLVHMMDALSEMQKFSYEYIPVPGNRTPSFEDSVFGKGAVSYLSNNEVDYVLSSIIGTPARYKKVDFSASFYYGPFGTIVPYPTAKLDFSAPLKPLTYEVWILVAVSTIVVASLLLLIMKKSYTVVKTTSDRKEKDGIVSRVIFVYVMGNLLSQGEPCHSKRLAIRILFGTWCCACFFLIQIYSSTLTSHLTMPNEKPIVSSFYEIANTTGVSLTVNRGFGIDNQLQNIESGYLKPVADMLRNNPKLLCNVTADCLKIVMDGNAVFSGPESTLKKIIDEDLKSTHTCHYFLLKETFWSSHIFTALRKNSPYTKEIDKGICRLRETGLLQEWISWYQPNPSQCTEQCKHRQNQKKQPPRLSFSHLSSAFSFLACGYVLSVFVLLLEKFSFFLRALRSE